MGHDAEMDALVASVGMTEDIWVTKDGQYVKFEDLTDAHLANIISYLQRCGRVSLEEKLAGLESERDRRVG
jgi:cytochrome c1